MNSARMPTRNHHLFIKNLLEYRNTQHDYKVLQTKQRVKEENEMMQNEMMRLRNIRKNHRLEDYGTNVQNMKRRIDEYKRWLQNHSPGIPLPPRLHVRNHRESLTASGAEPGLAVAKNEDHLVGLMFAFLIEHVVDELYHIFTHLNTCLACLPEPPENNKW